MALALATAQNWIIKALRLTQRTFARGEIALAAGILAILAVLVLPMPRFLLDISLALSLTLSVLVLMVTLFIERPLQFNSFPTVLLVATLLRLSLNIASARLILAYGHEGPDAAGHVIQFFGNLLMGGNFVIGVIIFLILVVVNFIVLTKGATRIAEVAARFTLDAMPGKQLAIDADMTAGVIDETEARRRRKDLENEGIFFGAMDGAAKFVRGDATAGLLVTAINIIGGMLIGMLQHGLSFDEATRAYTALTIGDGLITQIPALIISVASGLIVTKSGSTGTADQILFAQLGGFPSALAMTTLLMGAFALMPGIPALPFGLLAVGTGVVSFYAFRNQAKAERQSEDGEGSAPIPITEEPIATALQIDQVRLELGYGLLTLINSAKGQRLTDQIKALRRQLASDFGFIMPSVRIQDNLQLPANSYVVRIREIDSGRGDLRPSMLLVMDPRGETISLSGEATTEPTFGLPAMWIPESSREEALFRDYTVVDPPTVITTHLTEIVKDNMADLLSYSETQKLLNEVDKDNQKLVSDVVPTQISINGLQRILQNLLRERVSIRDIPGILEAVAEATAFTRNIGAITEHVRTRLARQLSESNTTDAGFIPLITLSPEWEQIFLDSITGQGDDRQLSMAPSQLQKFIASVRQSFERFAAMGETPVLLTSPAIRPYVRSIVERFRPLTAVLSQSEIHTRARIKTLSQI